MTCVAFSPLLRRAAFTVAAIATWISASAFTIVLDPGHGGKDHGTIGTTQREKDINLDVARRVAAILEARMPDASVVMTRSTDVFIPLQERCNIANNAKGDIFVSIHTNSVDAKSPKRLTVAGASVYTLGQRRSDTNLDVAMRENSVIKLEDDYSTTYCGFDPTSAESYIIFELSQSAHLDSSIRLADEIQRELVGTAGRKDLGVRQEPFWVLVRTSMPAVLVELDFVCNPEVEAFLGSDDGRQKLAQSIANGIAAYRHVELSGSKPTKTTAQKRKEHRNTRVEGADAASVTTKPQPVPEQPKGQPKVQPEGTVYKIQFLVSSSRLKADDSRLKGLDADYYVDGSAYKYTTGSYATQDEALKALPAVKQRYNDAFVVTFNDGKRVK